MSDQTPNKLNQTVEKKESSNSSESNKDEHPFS